MYLYTQYAVLSTCNQRMSRLIPQGAVNARSRAAYRVPPSLVCGRGGPGDFVA